jgi:hypothetical protein
MTGDRERPHGGKSKEDKWVYAVSIAIVLAGAAAMRACTEDDRSAPASVTQAAPSRSAPDEATDIYNNYIAAARLCRAAGESGITAISSDPITAYEAVIRAKETCDESADRISAKAASDAFAQDTLEKLDDLRSECVLSHRLLARVYGKIAKLIDKGGGASQLVEARDLLNQGRDAEEYCHATLSETIRAAGGEVLDR